MLSWLFGGRRGIEQTDRVWLTLEAKLRAVLATTDALVVARFHDTRRTLLDRARDEGRTLDVALADELVSQPGAERGRKIVVAERHPLRAHDDQLAAWADAEAGPIVFHVSLEDPPFSLFIGQRVAPLLERLGVEPDVPIEHAMVSRSLRESQDKIRKRARSDLQADSAVAWMQANGVPERP